MAFDLDNEELKATRKLHGQYDGLYEDKSDKNVANIEIVIKDCREHLKLYGEAFITANELDRIEHILTEREQDKKRIQELEAENRIFKDSNVLVNRYFKLKDNSIPKQKVADVLQNNRNELFGMTYLSREQYRPYEMQIERINKIEQELLGGEK